MPKLPRLTIARLGRTACFELLDNPITHTACAFLSLCFYEVIARLSTETEGDV